MSGTKRRKSHKKMAFKLNHAKTHLKIKKIHRLKVIITKADQEAQK